jgi:hypothetical protein
MNSKERSFAEKTSAADKSIGFDYQYYYFLDKLLNLKMGQSVGLEIKDDVHTDLDADFQLLFQLKHTTQLSATGKPSNLTELDGDLWKTLSNWSKAITDKTQGREDELSQILFLNRTEFHLVTNKSSIAGNKFLAKILEVQREMCVHIKN